AELPERDVRDPRHGREHHRRLDLVGADPQRSGRDRHVSRLARALANAVFDQPVVRQIHDSYLGLLELVYLIRLVPAWSANATTRAVATSKLVFTVDHSTGVSRSFRCQAPARAGRGSPGRTPPGGSGTRLFGSP